LLFIHIGLQKTGTTSLQYYLKGSKILKNPLDKARFVKTREGHFKTSGNQTFFKKCRNNKLIKSSFANSNREIKIITCENFSSPYDKLISLKNLLNFLTREKINFKILYTSRNFEDFCKSLYVEEVTNSFSCEMRSYKKFRKYTKLHILNLEKIIDKYPLIQFKYSKNVNAEILKTLLKYKKNDVIAIGNIKENKKNFKVDIKKIEKIAFSNRFFGWLSIYRYKLRYRFKNDYLKAPPIYIFGTYLRSLLNLFLLNNY
tara:strand:+ start:1452 stop:2225 length:774 start_codon:yes stop_codon:yes gene_type:complete